MSLTLHGRPSRRQWVTISAVVAVVIGGFIWAAIAALRWAETHDMVEDPISDRMMDKKSRQLQRVLDGMIARDYKKVADAAGKIETISESMEWFIADKEYDGDRTALRDSLHALQDAAAANSSEAAILSADQLVDSCMRCHDHMATDPARRSR